MSLSRRRQSTHTYPSDSGSTNSRGSGSTYESQSTAPTSWNTASRPSLQHAATTLGHFNVDKSRYEVSPNTSIHPRVSTETYASTVPSIEDLEDWDDVPDYEYVEYHPSTTTDPIPSTPHEFGMYFPSSKRLLIQHDNTIDGNMNLRVEMEMPSHNGRNPPLQLFHLRMHDLRSREFSFRRHCRDSGREVCHCSRKLAKPPAERRPGLQRSVSNALASLVPKPELKRQNSLKLKRQDSGYDSGEDELEEPSSGKKISPAETNAIKLDFSNYAQVEMTRRGTKTSKRYDFEYWGVKYKWKRVASKEGPSKEISYHLISGNKAVAHIMPVPLTTAQSLEEAEKGGWVPPCSMWISDESTFHDSTNVADVMVATGVIALVDDCIKSRFHSKRSVHLVLPSLSRSPSAKYQMEYVGPKALIDGMFKRRSSQRDRYPTPLREGVVCS